MITVLRQGTTQAQMEHLIAWLRAQGLDVHISHGHDYTILGLIGDTGKIDMDLLASLDIVESVKRVTEPFKQCNRQFHPDDTVITVYDTADDLAAAVQNAGKPVVVLPNYTSMLTVRDKLSALAGGGRFWE